MWPSLLLAGYCVLVVAGSLVGGRLPTMIRWTHARMQLVLSLVGGLMLAVSLFVLFAHSVNELQSVDRAAWWALVGMLSMFFLIRAFHFHQHGAPLTDDRDQAAGNGHHDHDHGHSHGHAHEHGHSVADVAGRSLNFVGIGLGLSLHTLIDGIALAASVEAEAIADSGATLLGLGTFLAIVLHKPLDALSITSVMAAGGWSARAQSLANAAFALMCPLGAALFVLSVDRLVSDQHVLVGCALGFSAGAFLCIALGDLLPEIQFHSHHRLRLSAMLLLGVGVGYGVSRLESAHGHAHPDEHPLEEQHDHEGHANHEHGLPGLEESPRDIGGGKGSDGRSEAVGGGPAK